jgi:8-oxo-dGTP pyrophosphatase MutT (NUDIX family)
VAAIGITHADLPIGPPNHRADYRAPRAWRFSDCLELHEETGIVALAVRSLGRLRAAPALSPQSVSVFEATLPTLPERLDKPPDEDEIVGWKSVTQGELRRMVGAGDITDGFTLGSLALLFASQLEGG